MRTLCLAFLTFCLAGPALADPCTAKLPKKGTTFSGVVRYVGDGDSLCVGRTNDPSTWIEVRVENFYAPELNEKGGAGRHARDTLWRLTSGRRAVCVANNRSYDRIVATCKIDGKDVAWLLRSAGIREGGRGFDRRGR